MTRSAKSVVLMVAAVAILTSVLAGFVSLAFPFALLPRGELVESSVSPDHRWKVRVFYLNPGAAASAAARADVVDLENEDRRRDIYLGDPPKSPLRWVDNRTVQVDGIVLDVEHDTHVPPVW